MGSRVDGATVKGGVFLKHATFQGEVRLIGAAIDGHLAAQGACFGKADEVALTADMATIKGGVFLDGATVAGEIRLLGAKLGHLSAPGLRQANHRCGEPGLNLARARIDGGLFLAPRPDDANFAPDHVRSPPTELAGGLSLVAASVTGVCRLSGTVLDAPDHDVPCLDAKGATIRGPVFMDEWQPAARFQDPDAPAKPFRANGTIDLSDARIEGSCDLRGALLCAGSAAPAVLAEGAQVAGNLLFGTPRDAGEHDDRSARVTGTLRLDRARIDGALVLNGALLQPADTGAAAPMARHPELALSLEQARIGTRLEVCALDQASRGIVDLRGAATDLLDDDGGAGWGRPCHGSQPPGGRGARLEGILLRLDMFTYARLAEWEDRDGPSPSPAQSAAQPAAPAPRLLTDRALAALDRLAGPPLRRLTERLTEAFEDLPGRLGFAQVRPSDAASPRDRRFAFLMRQFPGTRPTAEDFAPQPFDQVVRVLQRAGHPQEADWFARQKRNFRRRCGVDRVLGRAWNLFTDIGFGHYFSPGRAFVTLILAILLGVALLSTANQQVRARSAAEVAAPDPRPTALLAKRRQKVELPPEQAAPNLHGSPVKAEPCWETERKNFHALGQVAGLTLHWPARYGIFADAAVTAFDLLLPVVELKQDDRCEINDEAQGHEIWSAVFALYSMLGLVILPMFLATVTGLLRRENTAADAKT